MNIVDIHSHILPGLDDGPKSIDDSVLMAKIAQEEGIKTIIATPHYIKGEMTNTKEEILDVLQQLNTRVKMEGIDVNILPGQEVYLDPEIPRLLREGKILSLFNTQYLLVELPMLNIPNYTEDTLYRIRLAGYTPIIAHPERNQEIIKDPSIVSRFIELGALCQINTWSILKRYGQDVSKTAETLLKHNMGHFLSTDAHSHNRRSPHIKRAVERLEELTSREEAERIINNSRFILENKEIEVPNPIKDGSSNKSPSSRGFLTDIAKAFRIGSR